MKRVLLLHLTGRDRPGILAEFCAILANHGVAVLDIGQAVIHRSLTLGLLLEIPEAAASSPVIKDVLYRAHEAELHARFTPIEDHDYERWVKDHGKPRHIVTLLGPQLCASRLGKVSEVLSDHGLTVGTMRRLSARRSLVADSPAGPTCVELAVRGVPDDPRDLRRRLLAISAETELDVAIQRDDRYRRNRRLVAFDMDSTLIQTEVIVELAKAQGVGAEVHAVTEAAMRGELDFNESLRKRLSLLKGLSVEVLDKIAAELPLTQGARRLMATLRELDYTTVILSGGFTYFANHLKGLLGMDYAFANELEIKDGKLTGNVVGEIVDGPRKAQILKTITEKHGLHPRQVIAVGDGANDLPMLEMAGLGVAFHAKPKVREAAEQALSNTGLDGILYLLGLRERDMGEVQ